MGVLLKRSRRLALLGASVTALAVTGWAVPALASAVPHTTAAGPHVSRGPTAPAVPANLAWHKLKLIHGWASSQSIYGTGAPAWAVKDGVVYLSGSMHQASGSLVSFATLPKAARPAHWQYIGIYTASATYSGLDVAPDGSMSVDGPDVDNSRNFSSLAGVNFLAAQTKPIKLHLGSGWHSGPSVDEGGAPSYKLVDGVVHLSGEIKHASGTNPIAFVLPKGDRPSEALYMIVRTSHWEAGVAEIYKNGDAYLIDGDFQTAGDLDGISFSVTKSGWHNLHLTNGWTSLESTDHTGVPSYRVSKGVVYLSGAVRAANSSASSFFATLPRAVRPAHNLYISTYTLSGAVGRLDIESGGAITNYGSSDWVFTSLAGISYPLGS